MFPHSVFCAASRVGQLALAGVVSALLLIAGPSALAQAGPFYFGLSSSGVVPFPTGGYVQFAGPISSDVVSASGGYVGDYYFVPDGTDTSSVSELFSLGLTDVNTGVNGSVTLSETFTEDYDPTTQTFSVSGAGSLPATLLFSDGSRRSVFLTGFGSSGQSAGDQEQQQAYIVLGPAVPEVSTTVSFGLLLALGASLKMGGLVIAARRRKAGRKPG